MKNICVVTSTRAEYGLLSPLLRRIEQSEHCRLHLVVTGTHLSRAHGHTIDEIQADGFTAHACIPILEEETNSLSVAAVMAKAIQGFGAYFEQNKTDMLVVLGDRYEICAICMAAVDARIPIAHLHGGETTEGAADECFRHAITKMSYLHFTANETYRRRVIQLGESPSRVFNVGALGVENVLNIEKLNREELKEYLGFDICEKPCGVVTFHPVTLENNTARNQRDELLSALEQRKDMQFIITKANADAGGNVINATLERFVARNPHCRLYASLGMRRYLSVLSYACCVIGNSSSGIIEAPSFGIPTINIGDRQRGRMKAESVIDCETRREDILMAIDEAMLPEFKCIAEKAKNPYGTGETSRMICEQIEAFLEEGKINLKKSFYDIKFEV